jgi:hypothetical protein
MSISGHKTYAMFKKYDRVDRQDRQKAVQSVRGLIDTNKTRAQIPESFKVGGGA